jgi:hypothetical protein
MQPRELFYEMYRYWTLHAGPFRVLLSRVLLFPVPCLLFPVRCPLSPVRCPLSPTPGPLFPLR